MVAVGSDALVAPQSVCSLGKRHAADGGDKPPPCFFLTSIFESVQHTFFQVDIDTIRAISLYIQMHFI